MTDQTKPGKTVEAKNPGVQAKSLVKPEEAKKESNIDCMDTPLEIDDNEDTW
jgi:hypothetical protein